MRYCYTVFAYYKINQIYGHTVTEITQGSFSIPPLINTKIYKEIIEFIANCYSVTENNVVILNIVITYTGEVDDE